jgi:hypothetical protein
MAMFRVFNAVIDGWTGAVRTQQLHLRLGHSWYEGDLKPLSTTRFHKVLSLIKTYNDLAVHFVWETLPLVDFVTEFVVGHPEVALLVPEGRLAEALLSLAWDHRGVDLSRYVVAGQFRRCTFASASLPLCLSASLPLCLSASLPLCLSASLPLAVSVNSAYLLTMVSPCSPSYFASELYYPQVLPVGFKAPPYPVALPTIGPLLRSRCHAQGFSRRDVVLFLSRATGRSRSITNEDALLAALTGEHTGVSLPTHTCARTAIDGAGLSPCSATDALVPGLTLVHIVDPDEEHWQKTADLACRAVALIGPHGGALLNALFMQHRAGTSSALAVACCQRLSGS